MELNYDDLLKRAQSNLPQRGAVSRFDVPKPVVQQSGRQTMIRNFSEIARALRREPRQMAKYLFKDLAVPGALSGGELVLQGKIGFSMIDQRMRDYAKDFVLCRECGKPDTNIVAEKGISVIKCEACGARRTLRA